MENDIVRTTALSTDFLETVLSRVPISDFGPYRIEGEWVRAEKDRTTVHGYPLASQVDAFCRFGNAYGSDDELMRFISRWGLPNGGTEQLLKEVRWAARDMSTLVSHVEALDQLFRSTQALTEAQEARARHAMGYITKATFKAREGLHDALGTADLIFEEDADEVGAWTVMFGWSAKHAVLLTLHEGLQLQAVRATMSGETLRRCHECNGAFIYQDRPGVSGTFSRRESQFCTWNHAKRFGARRRRAKGKRS